MMGAGANPNAAPDADYVARFGGIGRLFGTAALPRLRAAHVCVIGIGGVGSWVVEALARTAIGALTIVDADDVCVTNVNRQLPALTDTVGRPKVSVMAERVRLISPSCRIEAVPEFYTKANAAELLAVPFDFVVDCVDRMSIKAHLIHECRERGLRILTCGSAGGRRDPSQIRASDLGRTGNDELLRQVRRQLRREHGWPAGTGTIGSPMGVPCVFTSEKPVYPRADGSCSVEPENGESLRMDCASGFGAATFITGVFGFVAASEVVRLLNE
jgi:tRNA A37 threonylcarbamoyladenosine dehydratase